MQTRYMDFCFVQIIVIDHHKVIMLDPSSLWGYEIKHAASHKLGDYNNAVHAFEAMLSMMEQSPDPAIRRE